MLRAFLLVLLVMVAAACGSNSSTPTPSAPASAPASITSIPTPGPEGADAPDLEALLPDTLTGVTLDKASTTGGAVLGDDPFSESLKAFLATQGKAPGDLRYAQVWDPDDSIHLDAGVFEVKGLPAATLRDAIVEASRPGAPGLSTQESVVGGKAVTVVLYPSGSQLTLYPTGERVFYVGSVDESVTEAFLAAIQ